MSTTKKILGLDLGVASIGWAFVTEENGKKGISAMGSRIIPLAADEKDEFAAGNSISKNQKRTAKRTQRKGYDRYQLRRKVLTQKLLDLDMFPGEELLKLNPLQLWGLRAKAVDHKIELKELGRILYHLNQKRGYKSSRSDANLDKKDTEYVAEVKSRYQELKDENVTIGQKFFAELQKDQYYRIKQQVFPREAYIEEFNVICKQQQVYYPDILTEKFIAMLRDEIIYFQRKLKSQKGLVSTCEFEGFWRKSKQNKEVFVGPKVAPKSSPVFQVCKIWESINAIRLRNKEGAELNITTEQKLRIFEYLDNNEKMSSAKLFDILGLKKNDGWYSNKQIERGIQGNITKTLLIEHLSSESELLQFSLDVKTDNKEVYLYDKKTGEILETTTSKVIDFSIEQQPLYKLWHTIYSIPDVKECVTVLSNKFNINQDIAEKLANIDFTKFGFGNKSVKAMRKILPYLIDGYIYSDACSFAGYNHSNSLTKVENINRKLLDAIPNLSKNSLRQPVVEKILNQMINLVNAIMDKYGRPDEIRVELARELKQSKDERNDTFVALNKRERENETIRKRLTEEFGVRATRNNVIKWRLFHEIENYNSKLNATCIYCGKMFGITDALKGSNVDVEHIIPKSLLFDDSQSNKTLSHRKCNEAKDNLTAYDFMLGKGESEFGQYLERINNLYMNKIIGKAKRDKLLMSATKIPKDFIERQLRETQYISRKSREILEQVCTRVWSTSGSVTEYLRRVWGWDDILMNLQLAKFRDFSLTEWREWETNDRQKHKKEVIKNWSKRDDHRHHAIDALVIACTEQGFIQRINNLSSKGTRDQMYAEIDTENKQSSLLESYLVSKRPFTIKQVEEKAAGILISFKAGKKVATVGVRKIKKHGKPTVAQTGIIIPRGSLSEESVYGKIKVLEKNKPVKYLFENPALIFKPYIKRLVIERLSQHGNDLKKALASLKKDPVYLDETKTKLLEYGTCYKEEYVIKYAINNIKAKDAQYIVDKRIKEIVLNRLKKFNNKDKEAFKEPLYLDDKRRIEIRTIRMLTGLSSVVPVSKDKDGKNIGFVKPGNNHHIAFYIAEDGKMVEHCCTFWHAVERKKYGIPVVIRDPKEVWDKVLNEKAEYAQSFLEKLPNYKWRFNESLQQNEMFLLGLSQAEAEEMLRTHDKISLSRFLYLTWSISESDYWFRHHLETKNSDLKTISGAKESKRYYRCKSIGAFTKLNPIKVRINCLGEISHDQTLLIPQQSGLS